MNIWQSVITRSRVNDGYYYDEDRLPEFRWESWFQARLDYAREQEPVWSLKTSRRSREADELPAL